MQPLMFSVARFAARSSFAILKGIAAGPTAKGQLISKANCQAVNSSKKQTNEFGFVFWKKLKTPKRHLEII